MSLSLSHGRDFAALANAVVAAFEEGSLRRGLVSGSCFADKAGFFNVTASLANVLLVVVTF